MIYLKELLKKEDEGKQMKGQKRKEYTRNVKNVFEWKESAKRMKMSSRNNTVKLRLGF